MVFFSAVAVALAATVGVYRVLEKTKESSRVPTQTVVVAAQDVPEGMKFERLALSVVDWPSATVPAGSYSSIDSVVGRVAKIPVFKGEPIVPGRLAPPGTGPGLEVKITPGKRAMAIKINDVVGIAGMIRPDSRVDVLVTLKEDDPRAQRQRAKLFMSNMRVLSVGTDVERGDDGKPINATTAALEVTPDEAERLAIAMNQGTIQLVLRGYGDPDSIRTAGATSSDVMAQLTAAPTVRATPVSSAPRRSAPRRSTPPRPAVQQAAVAPPPKAPEPYVIQVFRGEKVTSQKVDTSGTKQQD
jgi:pilus assembly protein CpaB